MNCKKKNKINKINSIVTRFVCPVCHRFAWPLFPTTGHHGPRVFVFDIFLSDYATRSLPSGHRLFSAQFEKWAAEKKRKNSKWIFVSFRRRTNAGETQMRIMRETQSQHASVPCTNRNDLITHSCSTRKKQTLDAFSPEQTVRREVNISLDARFAYRVSFRRKS